MAGSGPEAGLLEGVSGIHALGAVSGEAVRREMCQAMALVLPSICYENFPRTLAEAFGCGLPVIASRIGALAVLVEDGVTGLLFEPGNAQEHKLCSVMPHDCRSAFSPTHMRFGSCLPSGA